VIADKTANPIFVASDLLSQAEHGTDSQVVLVAISLPSKLLSEIEEQIDIQAKALPRVEIAKEAIKKSLIVMVDSLEEGVAFSNEYAPEHLILHLEDSAGCVEKIDNAGSVFVGQFSPESYVSSFFFLLFSLPYPFSCLPPRRNDCQLFVYLRRRANDQMRRLRLRNEPHSPDKRFRTSILWCQHPIFPKTHYVPRTYRGWIEGFGTYCRYVGRKGGVGSSCECCEG